VIRTSRALLASTLALVMLGFTAPLAQADDNVITDPNLRACLNTSINRAADTAITEADLSSWSNDIIDCSNQSIASLEGMQHFNQTYPAWFKFEGNQITDISPLTGLNIGQLDLYDNKISDISAIATLPGLVYLGLADNMITDPSPISGLPNLMFVGLMNNKISDISGLTDLPRVASLALDGNQISDISVLASAPTLSNISLDGNSITDLSPLVAMYTGSGSARISAIDQKVRFSAVINTPASLPTVTTLNPSPAVYDTALFLGPGNVLAMTPSSTDNIVTEGSTMTVTYLAPGGYTWTWRARTVCESGNAALDPTCWPSINFSGTAVVTVPGPATGGDNEGSSPKDTSAVEEDTSVVAQTGGAAVHTGPLAVLLIAAGLALFATRRRDIRA